jgi:peptidoglycan/LPS O-acetylase OafA/YrhL
MDRHENFDVRDVPAYWVRRGSRLYPLLIVAAGFGALLQSQVDPGAMLATSEWADWHYNVVKEDLPLAWAKYAIGWSNSLNSPAWSIRIELIASFAFPALYWLCKGKERASFATVALILLMFLPRSVSLSVANLNIYLFCFFAGALIPRYAKRWVDRYARLTVAQRGILLAAAVLSFMFARQVIEPASVSAAVVLVETLCSTFIVSLALLRPIPDWMNSATLQYLGRISYGIYLLHLIVLFALVNLFVADLPRSDTSQTFLIALLLCGATILITLPLAGMLYAYVEMPMQRLGSQVARRIGG